MEKGRNKTFCVRPFVGGMYISVIHRAGKSVAWSFWVGLALKSKGSFFQLDSLQKSLRYTCGPGIQLPIKGRQGLSD